MSVPPVSARGRPLSPHLTIYQKQLTSVLSISHRLTGIVLSAGTLVLVALVAALASQGTAFATLADSLATPLGRVALIGWSFCFYFHLCSGLRHLVWDTGSGFDLKTVYKSGYAVVAAALGLTALTWGIVIYG